MIAFIDDLYSAFHGDCEWQESGHWRQLATRHDRRAFIDGGERTHGLSYLGPMGSIIPTSMRRRARRGERAVNFTSADRKRSTRTRWLGLREGRRLPRGAEQGHRAHRRGPAPPPRRCK